MRVRERNFRKAVRLVSFSRNGIDGQKGGAGGSRWHVPGKVGSLPVQGRIGVCYEEVWQAELGSQAGRPQWGGRWWTQIATSGMAFPGPHTAAWSRVEQKGTCVRHRVSDISAF